MVQQLLDIRNDGRVELPAVNCNFHSWLAGDDLFVSMGFIPALHIDVIHQLFVAVVRIVMAVFIVVRRLYLVVIPQQRSDDG